MRRCIRIGSRESRLAVVQTRLVADYIQEALPEAEVRLVTMKTTGDRILDRPLEAVGGKGLFVKELDRALLEGRTELSVHSLKDLPMDLPAELPILGYSRREDPRDVLVLPAGSDQWDRSKPLGCSSKRRILQLQRLYPEVRASLIRGNVQTRLRKLDEGRYGAIVLAAAGLKRLGLEDRISRYFSPEEMLPAAGQGILAVQGRAGMDYGYLHGFFDPAAGACARAERAFVRALDGGCSAPMGAYGELRGDTLVLTGMFCREDGGDFWRASVQGPAREAEELGKTLAQTWRDAHGGYGLAGGSRPFGRGAVDPQGKGCPGAGGGGGLRCPGGTGDPGLDSAPGGENQRGKAGGLPPEVPGGDQPNSPGEGPGGTPGGPAEGGRPLPLWPWRGGAGASHGVRRGL